MGAKLLHLLASAAEQEGVAAFEADDFFALQRLVDEDFFYFFLRHGVTAAGFSHVDALGLWRNERQNAVAGQAVVDHHIGAFKDFAPAAGQQSRVSGPCAYKPDFTGCHDFTSTH